jgi:hypothetical protein
MAPTIFLGRFRRYSAQCCALAHYLIGQNAQSLTMRQYLLLQLQKLGRSHWYKLKP